jgi:uncharacterized protein DUF5655
MSLDEYFASRPDWERPIFERLREHLDQVGPLRIEAVTVGVFFRRTRTFAELRPMRNRLRLSLLLSRPLQDPRIVRTWHGPGMRSAYFVDLRDPADVDDELLDWLTEAYLSSPE